MSREQKVLIKFHFWFTDHDRKSSKSNKVISIANEDSRDEEEEGEEEDDDVERTSDALKYHTVGPCVCQNCRLDLALYEA
jgi:hypothetical protein